MGKKKLTEQDKSKIRELSGQGYSPPALAAMYSVSRQTIYRILRPDYYAKTLEYAKAYQKENAARIQRDRSNSIRRYYVSFSHENDAAVIEHLNKQENVCDYIRTLVNEDIKRQQEVSKDNG